MFERRQVTISPDSPTGTRRLRGRAVVFDEIADIGAFRERISPTAVERTFAEQIDVRALVDHDPGKPIGRLSANTLRLFRSRSGLDFEIDPPNTTAGRDITESVSRGDVSGMSFGFSVVEDQWSIHEGEPLRTVTDARIWETSIVTFPAYLSTSVTARVVEPGIRQERAMDYSDSLERRPVREERDTARPRAARDAFLKAWAEAGKPADFRMEFRYHGTGTPTSLDERLAHLRACERFWAIEEYQRAVGRMLQADERKRRERLASGPPPRNVSDRLEWMRARAARW